MGEQHTLKGVFVIGRQHSGNTFLTKVIGQSQGFFFDKDENSWFERVPQINSMDASAEKVTFSTKYLLRGKPEVAQKEEDYLTNWINQHPKATAYELFMESMAAVCRSENADYWVLKATSYIFYAEEILQNTTGTKLIYIMRNPLDLTASTRKRAADELDWLIATNMAWRKGVQIALKLQAAYPDRFRIVKYEILVAEQEGFTSIFAFLGLPYHSTHEQIAVTNTSDNPYAETATKGVVKDRIYYFPKVLSKGEVFFATKLAGGLEFVQRYYPDIPVAKSYNLSEKIQGSQTLFKMSIRFAKKHLNIFSPLTFYRLFRRIRLMISNR